jgi:hypothetical protein
MTGWVEGKANYGMLQDILKRKEKGHFMERDKELKKLRLHSAKLKLWLAKLDVTGK